MTPFVLTFDQMRHSGPKPVGTRSELFSMMVAGFASIAGSVMGVYLAMGIPATALLSGLQI